jgi:tetratricopeptide (TPR) repeat protein
MRQWDLVSETFAELSRAAEEAPPGPERVRAHEAALTMARASGSFAEEFVARLGLTSALSSVPRDRWHLLHFAWLRSALDPSRGLDGKDRDAVLWRLTWAVDLIEELPEIDLQTLVAAIDEVEEVFRAEGYPLGPLHAARARLAHDTGDAGARQRELAAWLTGPIDERGDCPACERRDQAMLVMDEDPTLALELVRPVVGGELTCDDEPRVCFAIDAQLRLRQGDVDRAVGSLRSALQLTQDEPAHARTVADCLRVLLRLGNADRAVDLLLPRLGWLPDLHTPRARMWFAATAAHVLDRGAVAGLAPPEVGGRPLAEVVTDLRRTARWIAAAFDARYGSTVTSQDLGVAHDDSLVPLEPTLPPTRLPSTPSPSAAPVVPRRRGVIERAEAVDAAMASLAPELDEHVRAWLRDRDALLPVHTPEEWAAVSLLDRLGAQQADGNRQRTLLDAALRAANRCGDIVVVTRCRGELAVLEVAEGTRPDPASGRPVHDARAAAARTRAREMASRLELMGADAEAGGLWRRISWFGFPNDPAADLDRAATAYGRAGMQPRRLLCEVEAAMALAPTDPAGAVARLDDVERRAADHPAVLLSALEVRSRIARATGDDDAALAHLRRALGLRGVPEHARLTPLLGLCEILLERAAWFELESPAADLVAVSTRLRDPVLLAYGQRFLGVAYAETGRPVEAAEMLEPALPVLRPHGPALVAPVGWALGNALLSQRQWGRAHTAFATAAAAFDAQDRVEEAAHAHWRAGNAAWDAGKPDDAARHFEHAVDKARASNTVALYVEALRSRGALRAETEDLARGIAELDAAVPAGELLAAEIGSDEDEFDGEVLEPHVLRQGALILGRHGEVDAAVERLARAESLVGAELELILRAEAGAVLADHDRLDEAVPRLRASLAELHAAGLVDQRVEVADVLVRALGRAGRHDEADRVWHKWGPEA